MDTINPKLTLVGAGPGDPDLLTIKGQKVIEDADVILYDALINKELLKYAKKEAELIYVGKRKGMYTYSQEEINNLIVTKAYERGHVVRLKGGDSFIFGRGAEEVNYARSFAVTASIVPGISSSISVPSNIGISLTHRGVSQSLWILTGTTSNRSLSPDIKLAVKSNATVVILMGMSKLHEIIQLYKKELRGQEAIAIIQNGTTKKEKIGIGNISNIEEIANKKDLGAPAIIVIGEVVKHRVQLEAISETVFKEKNVA